MSSMQKSHATSPDVRLGNVQVSCKWNANSGSQKASLEGQRPLFRFCIDSETKSNTIRHLQLQTFNSLFSLVVFFVLVDLLSALKVSKANFKLPAALNGRIKWIFHKISNERQTPWEFRFVEIRIFLF